jgi:hypothetical protein
MGNIHIEILGKSLTPVSLRTVDTKCNVINDPSEFYIEHGETFESSTKLYLDTNRNYADSDNYQEDGTNAFYKIWNKTSEEYTDKINC